MYFFRSIITILLIVLTSFNLYKNIVTNEKININKKQLDFIYLLILQLLFILFSENTITVIFLDYSCFLCYMLKRRKNAIIISLINTLFLYLTFNIHWFYYFIYLVYLGIDYICSKNNKNSINYLLVTKSFITSFIYFIYFEPNNLRILYIIFIILYFSLLLKINFYLLNNKKEQKKDNSIIFKIAHEVKNPICVCKGYLDMIDLNDQNKINKYIPIIKSEMSRVLAIMDDFLNLKRLTINKEIMDLTLLLEDVSTTMSLISKEKNIKLIIPKIEDEILLEADYDRLKQVFINLIKNSYEANSKNINISISLEKNKVLITVIDDGDGIEEKELNRIGDIFYTTKPKGTGIGVNLSKEIIKLHDGNIIYKSKIKEGTKVIISLPYYMSF